MKESCRTNPFAYGVAGSIQPTKELGVMLLVPKIRPTSCLSYSSYAKILWEES